MKPNDAPPEFVAVSDDRQPPCERPHVDLASERVREAGVPRRLVEAKARVRGAVRCLARRDQRPRHGAHETVHGERTLVGELREAHGDAAANRSAVLEPCLAADEQALVAVAGRMPRRDVRAVQIRLEARPIGGSDGHHGKTLLACDRCHLHHRSASPRLALCTESFYYRGFAAHMSDFPTFSWRATARLRGASPASTPASRIFR